MCLDMCRKLKFTKYQILLLVGLYVYSYPLFTANQLFPIFGNAKPNWQCAEEEPSRNCSIYAACDNVTFVTDFESVRSDFALVCDQAHYASLIATLQMLGLVVGNVVFGQFSDTVGRKPTNIVAFIGIIAFSAGSTWCRQPQGVAGTRFMTGFFIGGFVVGLNTLIMETIDPHQRMFSRGVANVWGPSRFLYALVAYLTRDWKLTFQIINLATIPIIPIIAFALVESPRWLVQQGKEKRAEQATAWIAKVNGQKLTRRASIRVLKASAKASKERKIYSYKDLFSTGEMAKRSLLCAYIWFTCACVSYGMDLKTGEMPGNRFVNQMIVGGGMTVGKPMIFVVDWFWPGFNRRMLHQTSMGATLICMLCVAILSSIKNPSYSVEMAIIAISVIGVVILEYQWDSVYLYSAELFPTVCRSVALGFSGIIGRCGNALAPQIVYLSRFWAPAPYVVFLALGTLVVIISIFFLPDTKGLELPDTIDLESVKIIEDETESGDADILMESAENFRRL